MHSHITANDAMRCGFLCSRILLSQFALATGTPGKDRNGSGGEVERDERQVQSDPSVPPSNLNARLAKEGK